MVMLPHLLSAAALAVAGAGTRPFGANLPEGFVASPDVSCERDMAATKRWKGFEGASAAPWTAATRRAAREALDAPPPKLERPRVFVYPTPAAFENLTEMLKWDHEYDAHELDYVAGVAAGQPPRAYTFLDLTVGPHASSTRYAKNADGHLVWTPAFEALGAVRGDDVLAPRAQHAVGLALHRGLGVAYDNVVDDPNAADLFFVPYHESVPPPSNAFAIGEERCRVVRKHFVELLEAIWDMHLAEFVPNGKDYSFMDRRWGRDHFLGASRAWHTEARELTPTRSRHEACREAEQFSAWRQARVLRVENQDHFRRAYLRDHPVPHVAALLPRGPRWDAFDAREKRSEAVAWARAPRDGAAVRPSLAAACGALGSRHGGCVEVLACVEISPGADQTSKFSGSVKSMSIRLFFGRIVCSRRVLEAQPKRSRQNSQVRAD